MRKRVVLYILLLFISHIGFSQVGIGNTDPKAQLDIAAGATLSAKDGLLIPRLDEFPTGVAANQNGMLVFITGNGMPTKGFYYWDNGVTNWIPFGKSNVEKIDDLTDGKSDVLGSSLFLGVGAGASDDGTDNMNVAVGYQTLFSNSIGAQNTAVGYQTLNSNISGNNNIALGTGAMFNNTSGHVNIALGRFSLPNNLTGQSNIAIGQQSLNDNTSGDGNIAIGFASLFNNVSGSGNVTLGLSSLRSSLVGINNTAIGSSAGRNSLGNSNIFIGYRSGYNETGNNKLYIENSITDENGALLYGEFDNNILRTNSEFQIGNPTGTGYAFPTTDGISGQVLTTDGSGQMSFAAPTIGVEKIDDLLDGKSDGSSIFLGTGAGANDDSNNSNFGLGIESLYNNIDGIANTALGYRSLYSNVDGNSNLSIGFESLNNNLDGSRNIAMGSASLRNNISGNDNIAIGYGSFIGNVSGSNNIVLGESAGPNSGYTGNSGIFIGGESGDSETQGNRLYIENSNANENGALIYGEFDNNILRTNSEFQIGNPTGTGFAFPTTDGSAGQVLITDGSGQISFETPTSISTFSLARIVLNTNQNITGTGYTKINFDTVDFDVNSDFNTTNDEFIVPVSGYYRIYALCRTYGVTSGNYLYGLAIYVNDARVRLKRYNHTDSSNFVRSINQVLALNAGDEIDIRFYGSSAISISSSSQETSFIIERIR